MWWDDPVWLLVVVVVLLLLLSPRLVMIETARVCVCVVVVVAGVGGASANQPLELHEQPVRHANRRCVCWAEHRHLATGPEPVRSAPINYRRKRRRRYLHGAGGWGAGAGERECHRRHTPHTRVRVGSKLQ